MREMFRNNRGAIAVPGKFGRLEIEGTTGQNECRPQRKMLTQSHGPLFCDPSESHPMFRLPTPPRFQSTTRISKLLLTVSLLALLCRPAAAAHADETRPPNVLVILADDMEEGIHGFVKTKCFSWRICDLVRRDVTRNWPEFALSRQDLVQVALYVPTWLTNFTVRNCKLARKLRCISQTL